MDRLNVSMDVLRRFAKEADDPNCVVLAERAINDYLKPEIDALKAAIERIGKAIDEEAAKGQGEDWSLMVGYVQSCRENLGECDALDIHDASPFTLFPDRPLTLGGLTAGALILFT